MLVLTRKCQQTIQIADNITITILQVKGHSVRVGIEAPRDVRVVRGELPPEAKRGAVSADEDFAEVEIVRTEATLETSAAGRGKAQGARGAAHQWTAELTANSATGANSATVESGQRTAVSAGSAVGSRPLGQRVTDVARRRNDPLVPAPLRNVAVGSGTIVRR